MAKLKLGWRVTLAGTALDAWVQRYNYYLKPPNNQLIFRTFAPMKVIHVDMDQFFAAVEQHDNPELKGKPIAVGHDVERELSAQPVTKQGGLAFTQRSPFKWLSGFAHSLSL